MLGTNLVEDIVSFDLIPHTSIYEAKWLRKFQNSHLKVVTPSEGRGGGWDKLVGDRDPYSPMGPNPYYPTGKDKKYDLLNIDIEF